MTAAAISGVNRAIGVLAVNHGANHARAGHTLANHALASGQSEPSRPGAWVAVGAALWAALYFGLEGRVAFFAVAEDPLWWIQRIGGVLIAWVVFDIDEYKPRWRSIPTVLIPVAGAGLCTFSLLGKNPAAWPIVAAIALLAFGIDWLLIRRWRVYFAVQQRARTAEAPATAPVILG